MKSRTSALNTNQGTGSFSRRILGVLTVVLAVALLGSGIGFLSLLKVSTETGQMVDEVMAAERLTSDLSRHIAVNISRSRALALSSEPHVGDALSPEIGQTAAHIDKLLWQLSSTLNQPGDQLILSRAQDANKSFLNAYQALTKARDSGLTSAIEQVVQDVFQPSSLALEQAVMALGNAQRAKIDASAGSINDLSVRARWGLAIFGGCAVLLGVFLSVWLVRSISRPIQQAVDAANRVASLDLSTPIEGHNRDEAGRLLFALAHMQTALQGLATEVQSASHSVAQGATEIAAGNLDFSNRTETSASFLQETAVSLEALATILQASLEAASRGEAMAQSAVQNAADGSAVMSEVMQTMADINDSSRQVMDITGVIDSIAFQTNILALNAAVEAARAGEQGRGFAVVATEVRTLSNRSAMAAREIKSLIETSAAKVKIGTDKAGQALGSMKDIVSSVERVTQAIGQITLSSHEQSSRMISINATVNQLDQMTQQNAAVVEESAAAAQSLQDQADDLRDVVGRFQINGLVPILM